MCLHTLIKGVLSDNYSLWDYWNDQKAIQYTNSTCSLCTFTAYREVADDNCNPFSPLDPLGPVSPWKPCTPGCPESPGSPLRPAVGWLKLWQGRTRPCSPLGPTGPLNPFGPGAPLEPIKPGAPQLPGKPIKPGDPCSPDHTHEKMKRWSWFSRFRGKYHSQHFGTFRSWISRNACYSFRPWTSCWTFWSLRSRISIVSIISRYWNVWTWTAHLTRTPWIKASFIHFNIFFLWTRVQSNINMSVNILVISYFIKLKFEIWPCSPSSPGLPGSPWDPGIGSSQSGPGLPGGPKYPTGPKTTQNQLFARVLLYNKRVA